MKNYKFKSCDEMTQDVFEKIRQRKAENTARKKKLNKTAFAVCPLCAAAVLSVSLCNSGIFSSPQKMIETHTEYEIVNEEKTAETIKTTALTTEKSTVMFVSTETETSETEEKVTEYTDITTEEIQNIETEEDTIINETTHVAVSSEIITTHKTTTTAPKTTTTTQKFTTATTIKTESITTESVTQPIQSSGNGLAMFFTYVEIGETRYSVAEYPTNNYTIGEYIGKVGDFSGQYGISGTNSQFHLRCCDTDSVYYASESSDILLVKRNDGRIFELKPVLVDWNDPVFNSVFDAVPSLLFEIDN